MTEGDSKTKEISKQVYRQLALTGHTTQKLRKFIYHEVVYLNKRNYFSSAPQCSLFTNVVLRLVILWCWGKTLFGIILRTRGGIMLLKEDQSGSTVLRFRILFSSPSSFFNLLQPVQTAPNHKPRPPTFDRWWILLVSNVCPKKLKPFVGRKVTSYLKSER